MKRKLIALICMALPLFAFAGCGSSHNGTSSDSAAETASSIEAAASDGAVIVGVQSNQFKVVDNLLISENLPIVVDFNATWCGPCRQFSPIFHAVAERYKGQALFVSIDTDEYPAIAEAYRISSIPTVAFIMPGGSEMGRQVGMMPEQLFVDYVNQLVATTAGEDSGI